jgi:hypothetical protein
MVVCGQIGTAKEPSQLQTKFLPWISPAKRANPIRLVLNLGGPSNLTEWLVEAGLLRFMKSCPSIHLVAPTHFHAL